MKKKAIGILIIILIVFILICFLINYILSLPKIRILGKFEGYVSDFMLDNNQNIIVCGEFNKFNKNNVENIIKLNLKGELDKDFNKDKLILQKTNLYIKKIFPISDDYFILVYSYYENNVAKTTIAKYEKDGTKLAEFTSNFFEVNAIEKQDDGKIIVGGDILTIEDFYPFHLFRLNDDFTIDSTFDTSKGFNKSVYDILYKDSKIYVVGKFNSYKGIKVGRIVRLNLNGDIDASFKQIEGANSDIWDIDIDEKGNIYVAGRFKYYDNATRVSLARLDINGTLDLKYNPIESIDFSSNQILSKDEIPEINKILNIDGKTMIIGNFSILNGQKKEKIARISLKGKLDKKFKFSVKDILKKVRINDMNIIDNATITKILPCGKNCFLISVAYPSNSILVKVTLR